MLIKISYSCNTLIIPLYDDYIKDNDFSCSCHNWMNIKGGGLYPVFYMDINFVDKHNNFGSTNLEMNFVTNEINVKNKGDDLEYQIKCYHDCACYDKDNNQLVTPPAFGDEIQIEVIKDDKKIQMYLNKENAYSNSESTFTHTHLKEFLDNNYGKYISDKPYLKHQLILNSMDNKTKLKIIKALKELDDE